MTGPCFSHAAAVPDGHMHAAMVVEQEGPQPKPSSLPAGPAWSALLQARAPAPVGPLLPL